MTSSGFDFDVFDLVEGGVHEKLTHAFEAFDGVCREVSNAGFARAGIRRIAVEPGRYNASGGFGGIDDFHAPRGDRAENRFDERVMGASENQGIGA